MKHLDFYLFLGLKSHSGHKKLTSQKACLDLHTTVSKFSTAKKWFAVLRMTTNTTFGAKHYWKLQKTAILWHSQHRKSFFFPLANRVWKSKSNIEYRNRKSSPKHSQSVRICSYIFQIEKRNRKSKSKNENRVWKKIASQWTCFPRGTNSFIK